ncbi:MAG: hypothetical protein J6Y92_00420 [Lentisphaeria bacterium]|nr:hypothetical protein [Lentisphaeria bacterium]
MKSTPVQHVVRHALFLAVLAGIALTCFASCSKAAPETPMERSRVLLRLFGNLDRQDNDEALKNIETYRNLDPTNLFLSDFEHIVRANNVIASARTQLDAGDYAGASAELDAYCLKYGQENNESEDKKDKDLKSPREFVSEAKGNVDLLIEAQRLNRKMLAAEFSDDIRAAAHELETFSKDHAGLFPKLARHAATKIREADALEVVEKADACAALLQDAMDASAAGKANEAAVLTAIMELNADAAQTAGFEAWLSRRPANP